MSVLGALLLVVAGVISLPGMWNAARPVGDPTRRYSPLWLPAMVVIETAPFWVTVHLIVLASGLSLGAASHVVGIVGAVLVLVGGALGIAAIWRSTRGRRRLRPLRRGPVPRARGWARWVGRPIPTPPGVVELHEVGWNGGLTADIAMPADLTAGSRAPVLVYVHGGGWTGGDPQRQGRDLYHALASAGWVVVAVRYPFTPHVSVEEQIRTVQRAVGWVRTDLVHAVGVSPGPIALAGGSAGGHLAAAAALRTDSADARVDACVAMYGVFDLANRHRTRAPWSTIPDVVMGATVAEAPERYRDLSPIDQVGDDAPPFLLVHGARDTLVPIGETDRFADALAAAGRPATVVPVGGAEHAFDALSSRTTRTVAAIVRDWLDEVVVAPRLPDRDRRGR